MNFVKERILDAISTHIHHSIRDQNFSKADYFARVAHLLQDELNCQCAFIDRNMNIVQRVGFAASPKKLVPDYKSLDPTSCLTKAIPVLQRQFTQASPIETTGKIQKIFDLSFILAAAGEVPNYVMVIKFVQRNNQYKELLQELVNHVSGQLYMYEQHEDENYFHRHYILSLHNVIDTKSSVLAAHCRRVANYCKTIGGLLKLNQVEMGHLVDAAMIHDIGYVQIPMEILNRPGRLTNTELLLIRKTVEDGYRIVSSKDLFDLESIAKIIFGHMEAYDGKGYPRGLKGNQISRSSKILGIANAYDAMTSPRPYQSLLTHDQALEELKRCSGLEFDLNKARQGKPREQFDPLIVSKFIEFQTEWT